MEKNVTFMFQCLIHISFNIFLHTNSLVNPGGVLLYCYVEKEMLVIKNVIDYVSLLLFIFILPNL